MPSILWSMYDNLKRRLDGGGNENDYSQECVKNDLRIKWECGIEVPILYKKLLIETPTYGFGFQIPLPFNRDQ